MLNLENIKGKIVCIYGPTASFKSQFALELAQKISGVIINADSMQVYNGLPILTSQPSSEEKSMVTHKLYDIISLTANFSVNDWLQLAVHEINVAMKSGLKPILVGGTGLYFSSIIKGIAKIPEITKDTKDTVANLTEKLRNEEMHSLLAKYDDELGKRLQPNDKMRILRGLEVVIQTGKSILEWQKSNTIFFDADKFLKIYIRPEREMVYGNINQRFLKMLNDGVENEARNVLAKHQENRLPKIIGLSTLKDFTLGLKDQNAMAEEIQRLTRNYAKRQYTWFNNQLTHDLCISTYNPRTKS
jgi:tRNA dimethylallyltransferase